MIVKHSEVKGITGGIGRYNLLDSSCCRKLFFVCFVFLNKGKVLVEGFLGIRDSKHYLSCKSFCFLLAVIILAFLSYVSNLLKIMAQ